MSTVFQLLVKPFLERSEDDRVRIFFEGKPRPNNLKRDNILVEHIILANNDKGGGTIYDVLPWLTGCEIKQALFCWPCLLFVKTTSVWNTEGFCDFINFQDASAKHSKTLSHLDGVLSYQLFMHRHTRSAAAVEPILAPQEDQLIARNREMTKRIIDVICYMVTLRYPPQKGSAPKQLHVDDCIDILLSLKPYDSLDLTDDTVALLKKSPNLIPELVTVIAGIVRVAIKKETKMSTYVSLILNEHSVINSKSQLSTVLRFVKDGKVYERFLAFTELNLYKTETVILSHILNVIEMYDLSDRFAAFSCDGAVMASTLHLNNLKQYLHVNYPYCFFVPCYYHEVNFVLEQSLSHIRECYIFFNNVKSVKCFFQNNSKACEELNAFLNGDVLGLESNDWSNSQFLKVLKSHRRQFIQFFESVVNKPEAWDSEDYVSALALQKILQEFDMIFQLQAFSKIFDFTYELNSALSSISPESVFGSCLADELKLYLDKEREEDAFEKLWVTVVAEILEAQEPKPLSLKKALEQEAKLLHREFYIKIIDCAVQEITHRYSCLKNLAFFHILNYEKEGKFVYNSACVQSLMAAHGPYFDETVITNEIKVLCSNNPAFAKKSLHALMEFFISANLKDTFKYLFKLAELTLTMPCKPVSSGSGLCKFDKIRAWASGLEHPDVSQDLNFLCVEEELMMELKESPNFIYDVFGLFQQNKQTKHFAQAVPVST